jgi:hypothetical protein
MASIARIALDQPCCPVVILCSDQRRPAQHRFVKGRSGNPKGGSGKRRNDAHEERIKSLIIDEAYREVALREGDNVIKLPVIQAVIRQLAMAAAKGQPRSQRMLADLVRWVEGDRRELNLEFLKTMIEYKQYWDQELERRERLGLAGPEPLPHISQRLGHGRISF